MAVGMINQGWGGGGGVGGAEQCSAWQLCAAKLWHTRIVCDNCALQTYLYGAHCVPEKCATTVRCILAAHIVCQYSARQLCAANLPVRRTLCARIVRDNCAPHTCGAHCVPVLGRSGNLAPRANLWEI